MGGNPSYATVNPGRKKSTLFPVEIENEATKFQTLSPLTVLFRHLPIIIKTIFSNAATIPFQPAGRTKNGKGGLVVALVLLPYCSGSIA